MWCLLSPPFLSWLSLLALLLFCCKKWKVRGFRVCPCFATFTVGCKLMYFILKSEFHNSVWQGYFFKTAGSKCNILCWGTLRLVYNSWSRILIPSNRYIMTNEKQTGLVSILWLGKIFGNLAPYSPSSTSDNPCKMSYSTIFIKLQFFQRVGLPDIDLRINLCAHFGGYFLHNWSMVFVSFKPIQHFLI